MVTLVIVTTIQVDLSSSIRLYDWNSHIIKMQTENSNWLNPTLESMNYQSQNALFKSQGWG